MASRTKTPSRRKRPSPAPELAPGSLTERRVLFMLESLSARMSLFIEEIGAFERRMDARFDESERKSAAGFSAVLAAFSLNSSAIEGRGPSLGD